MRLKSQRSWTVPHRRKSHGFIWDAVVGGCPMLGSVTDSMTAVLDFEERGEFELRRKEAGR